MVPSSSTGVYFTSTSSDYFVQDGCFADLFPPEGVEIVDHYVMMGIGQVIVLRFPPDHLRRLNLAIENGAWGAYQTEFYVTYDLSAARKAAAQNQ